MIYREVFQIISLLIHSILGDVYMQIYIFYNRDVITTMYIARTNEHGTGGKEIANRFLSSLFKSL